MNTHTKRISSNLNPKTDDKLLKKFKCENVGIDKFINDETLLDKYYKNQLNIKLLKTKEYILAIAIFKVIEIAAVVEEEFPDETSNYLYIEYFAVDQRFKGKGYGPAFFEDLMIDFNEIIELLNLRGIALSSVEDAINFYEKLGFELFTKEHGKTNLMLLDCYNEEEYKQYFEDFL